MALNIDSSANTSSENTRVWYLLPLVVFMVLGTYFAIGLTKNPQALPSVLINQEVPPIDLMPIKGFSRGLANKDFLGHVSLVNIFGSWCVSCRVEHPFLMKLKSQNVIPVYGIDWRETSAEAGPMWLSRFGNPYTLIGDDPKSKAAIAFGVTGAPETFIIDKKGVIRYKYSGPMDEKVWAQIFWPIITELRK